ncbi:MAG: hypothetical protein A2Z16_11375 [Chloroflexi bacterium RBG_16_54_18]|nr:MAG: hypothetical protein A2Z16_11375 [Chloroflexi bacterium RBG_16_54_18]
MIAKKRMKISRNCKILVVLFLISAFWFIPARAQETGRGWSEPYQLSTSAGKASEAALVSDQFGYVHVFWTETEPETQNMRIIYSRFDGETWTSPNDIIIPTGGIEIISPAVDSQGTLHIIWCQGSSGPVYYSHAPAYNAQSASSWSTPVQLDIPGGIALLRIDSSGTFHVLFINRGADLGVYYTRSENQGETWLEPRWLDPDIPLNYTPKGLNFEIDEDDGLHAVWSYGALINDIENHESVRYIHSLDGGDTWSLPYTVDHYIEGIDYDLGFAGPKMVLQDDFVHIVWAAGTFPYRHHRFSNDRGDTWNPPEQIFGELHGQAGDGMTVDGAGRVHFFGQIRYPLGIYHAVWYQNGWTPPELIYMISQGEFQPIITDRIHAHTTYPVVRAGNQLVLTFTDGPADPNRRLFAIVYTLNDISPSELLAWPDATPTPLPEPTQTAINLAPEPVLITTPSSIDLISHPIVQNSRPDLIIWITLAANFLLLGAIVVYRSFHK